MVFGDSVVLQTVNQRLLAAVSELEMWQKRAQDALVAGISIETVARQCIKKVSEPGLELIIAAESSKLHELRLLIE
jgi:hypothetical protein